jgi:TP901 family phage tail tape measure protein
MAGRFSIDAVFRGIDMMTGVTRKLSKSLDQMSKSAAGAMTKINAASDKAIGGLKSVALAATTAGLAVGAATVYLGKAGADFEQQITNVGAVSLMTRDQIADLEKEALRLGATTKFTATQAAEGMELMAKAGFTNAEILQGIGGVLNAAAAEGAELAETAGHVSNVLKGMGLATSEATRVADVLTLASARTNSSISSLGESMANVSSTARQFNIPLEDVVASVALLQDVGLDASVAGSAVNTMLTQLAAPTENIKKKMKEMGVSFQDANGNMLPFADVLAQLQKSAEKSGGNMAQVAFFAELVGLRGQKAAANLKDLFASGKAQSLTKELMGAAGSAEKMAGLRMQTLKGDLLLLESAVDAVKVALFDTQNGPLREIVQSTTAWVSASQDLIKTRFVEYLDKGGAIVATFVDGVKNGFNDMKPVITFVSGVFLKLFGAESDKAIVLAGVWGERITKIAISLALFAVVSKAAAAAVFLYSAVTKGAAIVTAVWTFIVNAARAAMLAYHLVTKLGVASTIAIMLASKAATIDTIANTAATVTNTGAKVVNNGITRTLAASTAFFTIMSKGQTAALITSTGVLKGAAAGMAAFGLATVAVVGSFMILNSQLEAFKNENDGIGFGEVIGDWATNDKGLFETLDDKMDAKAKARRKEADKLAAGGGAAAGMTPSMPGHTGDSAAELAKLMAQTNQMLAQSQVGGMGAMEFGPPTAQQMSLDGASMGALENLQVTGPAEIVLPDRLARDDKMTITVRAEGGADAEVTEAPKTKGTTINLQPSGTP